MMRIFLIPVLCALTSCMAMRGTKHTYQSGGRPVGVGGAEVNIGFRPEGTRPGAMVFSAMVVGAAVATMDGPFRWRVESMGEAGVHDSLVVHRVRIKTTTTKRDEWYPAGELGRRVAFRNLPEPTGRVRARYEIPGLLHVKPEEDGRLDLWVDLSVRRFDGMARKTVHFALDPAVKSQNEMVFIPVEIVENFGKPLSEQDDGMWD